MVDLIAPRFDRVPAALRDKKQWVVWRAEKKVKRDADGNEFTKITKVPYNPRTDKPASSTRRATWSSFEEVCQAYTIDGWDGIGFVFSADDNLIGIDLDDCIDESGKLRSDAEDAVRSIRSYTEKSPSGNGLHIICEGRLPGHGHCDKPNGREMYQEGRFFTITAEVVGKLDTVVARNAEARAIYEQWFGQDALDAGFIAGDLAWDEDAEIKDLSKLGVSDYTRDLIVEGAGIEDFPSEDGSEGDRSAALFFACRELVAAGANNETILTILSDGDNFLAQPGLERRKGNVASAREWVWKYSLAKVVERWAEEAQLFDDIMADDDTDELDIVSGTTESDAGEDSDKEAVPYEKGAFEKNAFLFLKNNPTVRYKKNWYCYNGVFWKLVEEEIIERNVHVALRGRGFPMNTINNTLTTVKRFATKDSFIAGKTFVTFKNGVLDLAGWDDGAVDLELQPHDKKYRSTSCLNFDYDPSAKCPVWLEFLNATLEGDQDRIRLLRQWIGYQLVYDYRFQKMMLMAGESRSGKGLITNVVMKGLVGEDSYAGTSLSSIANDFGLEQLVHAKTAVIGDAHHGKRDSIGRAKETLLNVTGNDQVAINRKHKGEITGQIPARLTMLANELPRFSDGHDALGNRYLVLPFNISFAGKEDVTLPFKLRKELPGIFNWALDGLMDLGLSGKFVEPTASAARKEEIRMNQNPVAWFAKRFLSPCNDAEHKVDVDVMVYAYESFCSQIDMRPMKKNWFGKNLLKTAPYIKKTRLREGGERGYFYVGVTLDTEALSDFCDDSFEF